LIAAGGEGLNVFLTIDSVFYEYDFQWFSLIDSDTDEGISNWSYSKQTALHSLPLEYFDGTEYTIVKGDYCENKLWTIEMEHYNSLGFCEAENCWGSIDTGGPSPSPAETWVVGLGRYEYELNIWTDESVSNSLKTIPYFKKNGIECGEEIIMGINEIGDPELKLEVFPNPADKAFSVRIGTNFLPRSFRLIDQLGRTVKSWENVGPTGPGTYGFTCNDVNSGVFILIDERSGARAKVIIQ
jgi:hypothetical protein